MLNEIKKKAQQIKAKPVVAALNKNGFLAEYFDSPEDALQRILELVPHEGTVGVGGSVTIRDIGVVEELKKRSALTVYDHWQKGLSSEDILEYRYKQTQSDVFLSSSNAVTQDGKIVNWDGVGQRVASMIFGPRKVILVMGTNKIAPDLDSAIKRGQKIVAPMNSRRLAKDTPCVKFGKCGDCNSPDRSCIVTTILHKHPAGKQSIMKFHVLLIGRELGF